MGVRSGCIELWFIGTGSFLSVPLFFAAPPARASKSEEEKKVARRNAVPGKGHGKSHDYYRFSLSRQASPELLPCPGEWKKRDKGRARFELVLL